MHNLSVLYQDSGRPALAKSWIKLAEQVHVAMAFHHPSVLDYRACEAAGLNSYAVWLREGERLPEMESQSGAAMNSIAKLDRDNTTRASHRATLARIRNNRGASYLDTGRPKFARPAFEKARAIAEPLARAHPTVLDHALDLGAIYQNLGHMWGELCNPQEALEWYTRSVQLLEDSLKNVTRRAEAWRYLAVAYAGRATILGELHRHAEMRQDLARMRQLDGKPDAQHLRLYRARMLTRPGKAVPTALATSGPGSAGQEIPYRLGCIYLLDPATFRQETSLP
jgi:tetratricopeptide (TPR) repeat protein